MEAMITSKQVVTDRYRVVKSASRHEENNDDDKACNYQLMMSSDRRGYGYHGHSPPLQIVARHPRPRPQASQRGG
jgi:hypothetical protein